MKNNTVIPSDTTFSFTVQEADLPTRLDSYLATQFAHYSRSFLQHLIEQGHVKINDKVVQKKSSPLETSDQITVHFPPKPTVTMLAKKIDLPIEKIAENTHFIIINKPAGLLVHAPNLYSQEPSLVDWLLHEYKEIKEVGTADRPGIVHRLDKDTSGLIIIPRTNYAHSYFGDLFRSREIEKTYLAVVKGHPDPKGTIDLAIGRDPITKHRMATKPVSNQEIPKGFRHAITNYRVIEYFDDAALVELKPKTGRTHQIRVHMAAIGHPIIGDKLYGTPSKDIDRQALHAAQLEFEFDDELHTYSAPLPEDMENLIKTLRKKNEALNGI